MMNDHLNEKVGWGPWGYQSMSLALIYQGLMCNQNPTTQVGDKWGFH